jgi:hypothetical protein
MPGHLSLPEALVIGVGVKANPNMTIAPTATHFRPAEMFGRFGTAG